jgi:SAM-dependent methyltransferase
LSASGRDSPTEPAAADLWGSAEYEQLAARFAPVHAALVERLRPQPGDRWLDVATGTGAVARLAAQAGADVAGIDIAPRMIEIARRSSDRIRFEVGDAQALPYGDGSFDVVSSSFGVIFAPDHEAVAGELARVCAGRLGLTTWLPDPDLRELYASFGLDSPEGRAPFEWGNEDYVRERLGAAFELEIEGDTWFLDAPSGEAVWELWSTSAPPFKAMVAGLPVPRRDEFRRAYIAYADSFPGSCGVRVPRDYLLILGRRR